MTNSEELTEAINRQADVGQLKCIAIRTGMKTLHQDSMRALANVPVDMVWHTPPCLWGNLV